MQLTSPKAVLQSLSITSDDLKELAFSSLAYFSVFLKTYVNPRTRNGKEEPQGLKHLRIPFVIFSLKEFYDVLLKAGQFEELEIAVASKEQGYALIVRIRSTCTFHEDEGTDSESGKPLRQKRDANGRKEFAETGPEVVTVG